jgi:chorismate mutase|tara:strand:- start:501 stop:794 length:294 start_codon:yes stop_codon:yes gene_type:complete
MSGELVPAELAEARDRIDDIDREMVELLAARFKLTHHVGLLKAKQALEALDESREAEKLSVLRKLCADKGLDAELITELFKRIMREVVKNHNRLRNQ